MNRTESRSSAQSSDLAWRARKDRGRLEHSRSVATLEDWFDPKQLESDYVPTGRNGPGVTTRAVPGHEFGLDLADEDRKALLAFLWTL